MSEFQTYLKKENWEPKLYDRLNQLIDDMQLSGSKEPSNQAYMVFDFDETCIMGDIEDHLTLYLVDHLAFRMTPKEFYEVVQPDFLDINQKLGPAKIPLGILTESLRNDYSYLYDLYIKDKKKIKRLSFEKDPIFLSFRAKLIYYYQTIHSIFKIQETNFCPAYWFQGYDEESFSYLVKEIWNTYEGLRPQRRYYQAIIIVDGSKVQLESYLQVGLRYNEEVIQLMRVANQHGILSYVVSASPYALIRDSVSQNPLELPLQQIFGVPHVLTKEGKLTAAISKNWPIPISVGKASLINEVLLAKHGGRGPIAVFGDSMGDYPMLMAFPDTQVSVLINRVLDNRTKDIITLSESKDFNLANRYFIQERDENIGVWRPSTSSVLFEKQASQKTV